MKNIKLSVVLATYNEEQNIVRCLAAVKELASEMIVVDGSSTDNTRQLAKKMGAKVIKTTNKANFHINKQLAMDEAKETLVLQLDADEVVDKKLFNFIKKIAKQLNSNKPPQAVAWQIARKNLFLGKWLSKGGQYPDAVIRLYLNGKAKLPQADVHEQMKVDGPVAWAKGHLLHYANPSFADYMRKFNTYTAFTAGLWQQAGWSLSLGKTLYYFLVKPLTTFLLLFIRHKGFVDGYPGFVFALMSGLHFPVAYLKLWELKRAK